MDNPKFTIFNGVNSQYYFRLRSANGEIVLGSEGYSTNAGARAGIQSVKENAPIDSRYDRFDNPANYRFNLKAANGQVIGRSEGYTTSYARENGIAAVKRDASGAPIEDLS